MAQRSESDRGARYEHGTLNRYKHGKCRCDACRAARSEWGKRFYLANRERILAKMRADYRANPTRMRDYQRRYYLLHPEAVKTRAREHQKANPHATNPARQRATIRRQSRVRGAPFTPTALAYMLVLEKDPCCYCGEPGRSIDHIQAIATGGDGEWTNLTSACGPCNFAKNKRTVLSFLLRPRVMH